jgi:hypothetical protein
VVEVLDFLWLVYLFLFIYFLKYFEIKGGTMIRSDDKIELDE